MRFRHHSIIAALSAFLLLSGFLLSACSGSQSNGTTGTGSSGSLTNVSIGLGYIPDIQFAPFYVAQSKGYYKDAGLNVTFHHGIVNDLLGSMVAGRDDFAFSSGDEDLVARSKNLPIVNVSTIFQKFPVSLIVPANSPIKTLSDLKGHSIGVPGPFGATYVGLLALLYKAHLTTSDVSIHSIGFTQVAALVSNRYDAVVGYSNNEPLQLRKQGVNVRTFDVSDYQPLVSNGIVTTSDTLHNRPSIVRSFVQATLRGLKDVIADPNGAVTISKSYINGLTDTAKALEILKATIPIWQGSGNVRLGYNDPANWDSTVKFMVSQKLIPSAPDLTQVYTNDSLK